MRKDKELAKQLRSSGKSYREIRDALKVPVSTLSDWFSKEGWSIQIRKKLDAAARIQHIARIVELDRIRGKHLERVYEEARREAREDLEQFKYNPLFIAGLMLYWGEGDQRTRTQVRISNTDSEMIELFVIFLRHVCRIPEDKIRACVLIYPDIDETSNREYWSKVSGIPLERFTKSVCIQGRHKTRRLEHGVCSVVVSSTYFKVKMLEWLRLLPKELMNRAYYENI